MTSARSSIAITAMTSVIGSGTVLIRSAANRWKRKIQTMTDEKIEVGDKVLLCTRGVPDITPELKEMDGMVFRVDTWKWYGSTRCFKLRGCKSKAGVPFTIPEDWIAPIKEVKRWR